MMKQEESQPHGDAHTRERLLTIGGEVFARLGFDGATVRDICSAAGANIAAVHYHFGGKQGLYRQTFLHFYEAAIKAYPPDFGVKPGDPPPELLRAFVRSFFLRILDRSKPQWMAELMLREMIKPTGVLDELVDRQMVNMRDRLMDIVRAIVGRRLTDQELFHACTSVVGQIVFHKHCLPIICRMWPDNATYAQPDIDALADHVWRFCLAGLEAMKQVPATRSDAKPKARSRRDGGRSGVRRRR